MSVKAAIQTMQKKDASSAEAERHTVQAKHKAVGPGVPLFLQRAPLSPEDKSLDEEEETLPEQTPTIQPKQMSPGIQRQVKGTHVPEEEQEELLHLKKEHSATAKIPQMRLSEEHAMPRATVDDQAIAYRGVEHASSSLPHIDRIQTTFGRHDLSNVRAAIGGCAAEAAGALGAEAYTTGNRVGFRVPPDLRTAAHEAAHVIQQRAGAMLNGAVGRAGDEYEQHADAVADQVVHGQSVETTLDRVASSGASRDNERSVIDRHSAGALLDYKGRASTKNMPLGVELQPASQNGAPRGIMPLHSLSFQQRHGVRLTDGVGRSGDTYEQHADSVADKAVRGEPVQTRLDQTTGTESMAAQTKSETSGCEKTAPTVQCFGKGHQIIGDEATGKGRVLLAKVGAKEYTLTAGEVAYCGDYFTSIQAMKTIAKNILQRGEQYSGSDEIFFICMVKLYKVLPNLLFDYEMEERVMKRYYSLAGKNMPHFTRTAGGYTGGAAEAYLKQHNDAVTLAMAAAQDDEYVGSDRRIVLRMNAGRWPVLEDALAVEAFASHFLQDTFAAGHIRTERANIKNHWDAKCPNFWDNLKWWLVKRSVLSEGILANWLRSKVRKDLEEKLNVLPDMTLGDLIGAAMHDYDNYLGVYAVSDVGPNGETPFAFKACGEKGRFDKSPSDQTTKQLAVAATLAGVSDVLTTYILVKTDQTLDGVQLQKILVKLGPGANVPPVRYWPERYQPREARPEDNVQYDWKLDDFDLVSPDTGLGRAIAYSIKAVMLPMFRSKVADDPDAKTFMSLPIELLQAAPLVTAKKIAKGSS